MMDIVVPETNDPLVLMIIHSIFFFFFFVAYRILNFNFQFGGSIVKLSALVVH
ncbi:hypothetical protein HanPI659440_Chr00c11g0722901 [Helianthus annuus]|nr:hypothetical protein HanPI659440_Chr00c11g0722901 [Helianthus annuus]